MNAFHPRVNLRRRFAVRVAAPSSTSAGISAARAPISGTGRWSRVWTTLFGVCGSRADKNNNRTKIHDSVTNTLPRLRKDVKQGILLWNNLVYRELYGVLLLEPGRGRSWICRCWCWRLRRRVRRCWMLSCQTRIGSIKFKSFFSRTCNLHNEVRSHSFILIIFRNKLNNLTSVFDDVWGN